MRTKVFKNGNAQMKRPPAATAPESLATVLEKFARFPPDFLVEGRGQQEQKERKSF